MKRTAAKMYKLNCHVQVITHGSTEKNWSNIHVIKHANKLSKSLSESETG